MVKRLICVGFLFALVGCKAEIVETKVKTSDLKKSISGKMVTVPFSAVLSVLGDDANVRAQVKRYEGIIENYVDVEDFEISKSMMGMEIKVTGNLPLVSGDKTKLGGKDPWVLRIRKTANRTLQKPYPYRVALETTDHFASFKSEFTKLNMLLSPDPHQPLLMKIQNALIHLPYLLITRECLPLQNKSILKMTKFLKIGFKSQFLTCQFLVVNIK